MEHCLTRPGEPASAGARHQLLEGKLVVEHGVEAHVLGGQDAVEGLGLGHGAREAFEQESFAATPTPPALPHQAEHRRVRNQLSTLHVLEGSREGGRMVAGVELGCGSEQVARRQVTRTRLSARRTAPCLSDKSEAR